MSDIHLPVNCCNGSQFAYHVISLLFQNSRPAEVLHRQLAVHDIQHLLSMLSPELS